MGTTAAYTVALKDVNGDGINDLIAAGGDNSGGYASIRLGNGDGSFRASYSYQTDNRQTNAIALGDLNGDGILDLVTTGNSGIVGGSGTIRLGNSDGTFGTRRSFSPGTNSNDLAIGDINNDGILDIVVGTSRGYSSILLGNGDGTLSARTTVAMEASASCGVELKDLNGDGILDLISAGVGGGVGRSTIRLGIGDGTFGTSVSYIMSGLFALSLAVEDVNGDGILDLLTTGTEDGLTRQVGIRLGNGDGSFKDQYSYYDDDAFSYTPNAIKLGDLNGDGVLDIISDTENSWNIRLGLSRDGVNPILNFSLETMADSRQAISLLENKALNLSLQRGQIGAFQSRVQTGLADLTSKSLEYKAAYSRITDADIAQESANLVKLKILQDVAGAVLAQANLQPSLALNLLKGAGDKQKSSQ